MIKINLLKRKNIAVGSSSGGLAGLFSGGGKSVDLAELRNIDWRNSSLLKIALSYALIWGIEELYITPNKLEQIAKFDQEQAEIEQEQAKIVQALNKVKEFEPLKARLEDDEKIIQNKLTIISKLLESREGPSRFMLHLTKILPEEAWLTSLSVKPQSVQIQGGAASYNLVSDFVKGLSDSSFLSNVSLSQVSESVKDGIQFQQFDVSASGNGW